MRSRYKKILSAVGIVTMALAFQNCGSGGSGGGSSGSGGDWYYHWNCNGDSQCLSTNPTGAASGTADEGPSQASCTSLLTFATHFWGTGAVDSCDQSPTGGSTGPTTDQITGILNLTTNYWLCDQTQSPFYLAMTATSTGVGTGFYQKGTSPPSPIYAMTWQEGSDKTSFTTNITSTFAGLIEISANATTNATSFTYLNGAKSCTLKTGTLPAVATDLGNGYISQGGLTWSPNTADGGQTWSNANTYCTTATINGTTGWRLPTYAEIFQMFSSGAIGSTAQANGWGSVSLGGGATPTWTSDSAGTGSHKAITELALGGTTASDSNSYYVTCVK